MAGELKDHSPPLPVSAWRAAQSTPKLTATLCASCLVGWPATRLSENRKRLCEECYQKRRTEAEAENSSGSP